MPSGLTFGSIPVKLGLICVHGGVAVPEKH